MERHPISVTLLANAGLLISYRGTTLLLDGIFGREGNPFSPLPAGCWDRMCKGQAPFAQIDYLLFTHFHPDHFSPEMTMRDLGSRQVKGLFFPDDPSPRVQALKTFLRNRGTPCVLLSHRTDHAAVQIEPHLGVRAFVTQHLGPEFYGVPHVCYLISFDDRQVLFTADADYVHEDFRQVAGERLEAVFLNPLFYQALSDPRLFHSSLPAATLCVYHLPYPEDDHMSMHAMLRKKLTERQAGGPRVLPLTEPYQKLVL